MVTSFHKLHNLCFVVLFIIRLHMGKIPHHFCHKQDMIVQKVSFVNFVC